jgi:hypothetical protein
MPGGLARFLSPHIIQNSNLSASLDRAKEELVSVVDERARNEAHSKEHERRQQQVINDLSEQVVRGP